MKTKKIFSLLIAVFMLLSIITTNVFAVDNNTNTNKAPQISYTTKINGVDTKYGNNIIKRDESVTLSVEGITFNGQTPEPSKISYQWMIKNSTEAYDNINNAILSTYTFQYDGNNAYSCKITVTDSNNNQVSESCFFTLKEDSLSVSISSDPIGKYDDMEDYRISNVPLGKKVTLTVNPSSTLTNAHFTYEWERINVGTHQLPEKLSETSHVYTFNKGIGIELYSCKVSDGNDIEYVMFYIDPVNTLKVTPIINEFMPKRFERGYMYVAKPGEKVTLKVDAVSTNDNIEYSWQRMKWDVESKSYVFEDIDSTKAEITIEKEKETYDNNGIDPLGIEMYECYIKDGTELINVGFIVFNIEPDQVTKEVETAKDVPTISLNNSLEELSNNILKNDLEALSIGETAEVKLTAEKKDNLSKDEQSIIEKEMSKDSEVGMCLDINLYKKTESENIDKQITETQKDINISIDVPKDLINENKNVTRSYQVIRVHDGAAETLDAEFDSKNGNLTFNTDKFSTYVLTYKDVKNTVYKTEINIPTNDTTKPVKEVTVDVQESDKVKEIISDSIVSVEKNKDLKNKITAANDAGKKVSANVVYKNLEKENVDSTDKSLIEEKIKDQDLVVAQYLNLSIVIFADNEELGNVTELTEAITYKIAIPADLAKEGREFVVVRVHNGVAEILPTTMNDDGTLSFKTDRFSTYALVYKETTSGKGDTVNTGDQNNVVLYASLCTLALLGAGIVVLNKKREEL